MRHLNSAISEIERLENNECIHQNDTYIHICHIYIRILVHTHIVCIRVSREKKFFFTKIPQLIPTSNVQFYATTGNNQRTRR